ncbi:MAG TPA: YheC/YheD family protein [Bacilli bacterium]
MNEVKQIASKKTKTHVLQQDARIVPYIPETHVYSVPRMRQMLAKYGAVVLKPNVGTGGNGVIWVSNAGGGYELKFRSARKWLRDFPAVLKTIRSLMRKRLYLVQRGIHLAKISGRPLDYRIKLVRSGDTWETKAFVGRLARRGLFVTNLCQGGDQLPATAAIRRSLPHIHVGRKKREMRKLALQCRDIFVKHFPNADRLGFDFGLDTAGKVWIFELNTRPH